MWLTSVLRYALFILVPLSLTLTSYLYLYPVFQACAFPPATTSNSHNGLAPFRLLALGDPQLEGDTSLPSLHDASFPHLRNIISPTESASRIRRIQRSFHDAIDIFFEDVPTYLSYYHKLLDLTGNDYYLAHIYRTLSWYTNPTHVTVLGDLVGSQWIDDAEFSLRAERFWKRVFAGSNMVPSGLMLEPHDFEKNIAQSEGEAAPESAESETENAEAENTDLQILGQQDWKSYIINVAGNHDIGYAGDLTPDRLARFEKAYGKANYELRFRLPQPEITGPHKTNSSEPDDARIPPELRIVVLNDMNLDTPAYSEELQGKTYQFINDIIGTSHPVSTLGSFTLVLTHVPLYKEAGICVDGPFFSFHEELDLVDLLQGGLKEQNHLSADASNGVLEGIFGMSGDKEADGNGMGRNGIIVNGHDHAGCDVWHYINQSAPVQEIDPTPPLLEPDKVPEEEERKWRAGRYAGQTVKQGVPGIRELTVRSMMGDYGGNAGLLSLWFDEEKWEWKSEFANCALGPTAVWWAVHVVDLVTVGMALGYIVLMGVEDAGKEKEKTMKRRKSRAGEGEKKGNGHAVSPSVDSTTCQAVSER